MFFIKQVFLATNKAVANGLVGQILAGPLQFSSKNKIPFCKKQVLSKSISVIFGLV